MIVTTPEIAKSLKKPLVRLIGHGEAMKGPRGGKDLDLTYSAGVWSGPRAFEEAGITPKDIKYASIYDSFTITVLMQIEDLGFCKKGEGGKFVADGNLISGVGKLPFNTDGGGLCSNHPVNRGGMTKILEAVRQLRGEAHPKVQVKNCDLAIAHGTGGLLGDAPRRLNLHSGARVMAEAKKYPAPEGNPETAPFWEAAKHGKFMIKRCTACGEPHYFPRSICPFCFSDKTVWEESSGEGTIYTFSLMRKSADRALRDRLCHAEGRAVAADQHRRLRHRQAEDRPEGEGGVQADRRRAAAVLHAGLDVPSPLAGEGGAKRRMRGPLRGRDACGQPSPKRVCDGAGDALSRKGRGR